MQRPALPADVLALARGGDRQAFGRIVEAYQGGVWHLAWRMCYDRDEANDLAQEVFLRVFQKLPQYDAGRAFSPWFYRVATNVCLNYLRDRGPKPASLDAPMRGSDEPPTEPEDPGPGPDVLADLRLDRERVDAAIRELPADHRAVLTLYYLEGLGLPDLAEALGASQNTCKVRLFRAREALKRKLGVEEAEA